MLHKAVIIRKLGGKSKNSKFNKMHDIFMDLQQNGSQSGVKMDRQKNAMPI